MYDSKSRRHLLALHQYYFEGEETLLNLNEHGNEKNNTEPYVSTKPSTFEQLTEISRSCQPQGVFFEAVRQKGGLDFCRSKSDLSRNSR